MNTFKLVTSKSVDQLVAKLASSWGQIRLPSPQTTRRGLGLGLSLSLGLGLAIAPLPGRTVQLADGTIWFERPPSLADASTTRNSAYANRPTYYFTLDVPTDAGEPLGRIAITQRDFTTASGRIRYDLNDSVAFFGTRRDRGDRLPIQAVNFDPETASVSVTLAEPIAPGNTVTLGLRPYRNPRRSGVYLFGVTAFPAGDQAHGQFLGYGRLHFYPPSRPWDRWH